MSCFLSFYCIDAVFFGGEGKGKGGEGALPEIAGHFKVFKEEIEKKNDFWNTNIQLIPT